MCAHTIVHEIDTYTCTSIQIRHGSSRKSVSLTIRGGKAKMAKLLAESYSISLLDYVWSLPALMKCELLCVARVLVQRLELVINVGNIYNSNSSRHMIIISDWNR